MPLSTSRGFAKNSLELLSIWHGFYYDSHRAMNDVDAVIHLLTHPSYKSNKPIVELIKNSQIPYYEIIASNSPYESKDILRSHSYRWNGEKKYWWDGTHTTAKGSEIIAKLIFPELYNFIK